MAIKDNAIIIRDETLEGANTATRIGNNLVEIADDLLSKQVEIDALVLPTEIIYVDNLNKLPPTISGVITLLPNYTYFFVNNLDLLGSRLVGGQNTTILGASSENCSITSTGLGVGVALFTTVWTTPIRNITFKDVDTALDIDGLGNSVAIDWNGVNFLNVLNIGTIKDISNFIFLNGAFLNSKGILFDGTFNTIGFEGSIFVGDGLVGSLIELSATAVINTRFRIIYSSVVAFASTTGLNISSSATIPNETFILDSVAFSGGSTYLVDLDETSNKSLFINCNPIVNTFVNGQLYMQGNATATPIAVISTFYKVLGTTIPSVDNSKYTHTDNRLTCDAVIERKYLIQCNLSFDSGNNQQCEFGFYDSKLAGVRTPSRTLSTSNGTGKSENVSFNCVVNHSQGDYLEIWTANNSAITDITVVDLNFVITEIG